MMMQPTTTQPGEWVYTALNDAARLLREFASRPADSERVNAVAGVLVRAFGSGHKVLICGNGGSSADAMHFAEELTGRYRKERPALPAIACTDPGHITCAANDYGYERVFSRWVEALGQSGDVLLVLSTSGDSANILRAVEAGKARGMTTVALLGRSGGTLKGLCEHEWIVGGPADHADRIQEVHMFVLHALIEGVERRMFPGNY